MGLIVAMSAHVGGGVAKQGGSGKRDREKRGVTWSSIRASQNLAQVPTHHTTISLIHKSIILKSYHLIATLACRDDRFKFFYDVYDPMNEDSTYIPFDVASSY